MFVQRAGLLALASATVSAFVLRPNRLLPLHRRSSQLLRYSMATEGAPIKVLVPIGDGSEEIETSCITDVLTRAGADVTVASVMPRAAEGDLTCVMSRNLKILADAAIADCMGKEWALIALPGGMPGAEHLKESAELQELLTAQRTTDKMYAAVCASPAVALAPNGHLEGKTATCYPAPQFREVLKDSSDDAVVLDGNCITSQGPGTSLKFALKLVEALYGKEKSDVLAGQLLVPLS